MNFDGFNINNFKMSPRKENGRIEKEDIKAMLWLYSETDTPAKMIMDTFKIDRRTLYHHIHRNGIDLRRPGAGNTTNHPTKFDTSLRDAYQAIQHQPLVTQPVVADAPAKKKSLKSLISKLFKKGGK